jgi:hypothetical protein
LAEIGEWGAEPLFFIEQKTGLPEKSNGTKNDSAERTGGERLPRHPFPVGIGFAESLFTVTDFLDSPK